MNVCMFHYYYDYYGVVPFHVDAIVCQTAHRQPHKEPISTLTMEWSV